MNHENLIADYLAGVESLAQAIDGLDAAQLRARPIAGQWSTLEVVGHLADSEALFAERMKRVLAEDRPPLTFADPARWSAALAYDARDAAEELACLAAVRRQMARILRVQPPAAWQRVGVHSKDGERTLEQIVRKAVDHLNHHVAFIHAKRQALQAAVER